MVKYEPLIIGASDEEHITSKQWGAMNGAIVGKGRYLTNYGTRLRATVASANVVQVEEGMIYDQGRYIINEHTLSLTLNNGSQGYSRYDLICGSYNLNDADSSSDSPLEFGEWFVVEGVPSTTNPVKPIVETGDIFAGAGKDVVPVWSILISGLVPQTPVLELGEIDTLEALGEKMAEAPEVLYRNPGNNYLSAYPLSKSAADYKYLLIEFSNYAVTQNYGWSEVISDPEGKRFVTNYAHVPVNIMGQASNTFRLVSDFFRINENDITYVGGGSYDTNPDHQIKTHHPSAIIKVTGWK